MILAGVDEAGRGSLAGPVVAAAVIINDSIKIEGINVVVENIKMYLKVVSEPNFPDFLSFKIL